MNFALKLMTIEHSSSSSVSKQKNEFLSSLRLNLDQGGFVKLVLSRYMGAEVDLARINIRLIVIKGTVCLSFVKQYKDRDVTENHQITEAVELIDVFIGNMFKSAHLLTSVKDYHLDCDKNGAYRLSSGRHVGVVNKLGEHDRQKKRLIDRHRQFLFELGVTDAGGNVFPSMSDKWKQINKFIEFMEHAVKVSGLLSGGEITVSDFGCGKGYLTFAVYDYLQNVCKVKTAVVGVELKDQLVKFCNNVTDKLKCNGLSFVKGNVESHRSLHSDVLIALHACDTATDLALHMGIKAGSRVIMCSPCCHKQIRPQIVIPEVLRPLLRFGSHLSQEADMITDSLRLLLLEACGYDTDLFEFISLEHTGKNKMIVGIKHNKKVDVAQILKKIEDIKAFYGIKEHKLESLLQDH